MGAWRLEHGHVLHPGHHHRRAARAAEADDAVHDGLEAGQFQATHQQGYVHKDKGKVLDLHFQKNGTDLFNGWKTEECTANLAAIDTLFGNVGIKVTPRVMTLAEAYA